MDTLPSFAVPLNIPVQKGAAPSVSTEPNVTPFKAVLAGLGARMDQGEAAINAVSKAAPPLGPAGQLLALQASVYRYTETFEVAAKLVDKAGAAVKTTLQGQ